MVTEDKEGYRAMADEQDERNMIHVHTYNTNTFVADGHQHMVMGTSGPARIAGASHIHRMRVRTSFDAGGGNGGWHWHWFDVMTGPAQETINGGHIHLFQGSTGVADRHCHDVVNSTAMAPDIEEVAGAYEEPPPPCPPPMPKMKPKYTKR